MNNNLQIAIDIIAKLSVKCKSNHIFTLEILKIRTQIVPKTNLTDSIPYKPL